MSGPIVHLLESHLKQFT